jgi:hypothetical protein
MISYNGFTSNKRNQTNFSCPFYKALDIHVYQALVQNILQSNYFIHIPNQNVRCAKKLLIIYSFWIPN